MAEIKKRCSKCKSYKYLLEFYNYSKSKDGKTCQCIDCISKYRNDNKERSRLYMRNLRNEHSEIINETKKSRWRSLDPRVKMFMQSKSRARRRGIEHTISLEDIIVPEECPILKILFVVGTKDNYEQTPSLDRIDNSKGYIPGNVQVISKKANSMKNSGTKKELLLMADWIIKNIN